MADTKIEEIILIRKKRPSHAAHYGGSWKVAYADFVTAMMSLFIVLWLTSSNDAVKRSVAQYFNDPKGVSDKQGTNLNGSGRSLAMSVDDVQKLRQQLLTAARQMPNFDKLKDQVEITAVQDGLRIELLERPDGLFFQSGSQQPSETLQAFLRVIAPELGRMHARISIEGHTDSLPFAGGGNYTNWELSADRANAARRTLESDGVSPAQIAEVRGFADQLPRRPEAPDDPSNRRITLIVEPIAPPDGRAQRENKAQTGASRDLRSGKPEPNAAKPSGEAGVKRGE